MSQTKRFTVYDVMEAKGVFSANPANPASGTEYEKQVYPRMLYHPDGERRVTVPAEEIVTPFGPKRVGEQSEVIWRIVKDKAEEEIWLGKGWHRHPAKAMRAGGEDAPAVSPAESISDLEAKIKELEAQIAEQDEMKRDLEAPVVVKSAASAVLAKGQTVKPGPVVAKPDLPDDE